jgi:poly-gamma-glutamate system protein
VILVVITILAIIGLLCVEFFKVKIKQSYYIEKIRAATAMKSGMEVIKEYRISNIGSLDTDADPAHSGMIGAAMSPITSSTGYLTAKQTTMNPNWAAVVEDMLKRAKAKEGDTIALGLSGSFPAINLAALAAVEALK